MPLSHAHRPSRLHADLGDEFYDVVEPARFPRHILRYRNQEWAARVGMGELTEAEWIAHFGAFEPLPGSFEQPLALRYHGHQFRSYNPDLGDGRGFLFAQLHDLHDGRVLDLATKGSGRTPWSRGGDGKLTLKGGVREVLATAMLEALGVYTSKSFSLIETGEALQRGDEPSPTRSTVLVRLSHSHIRIGTFQRLAALRDQAGILRLLDHTVRGYMPQVWDAMPDMTRDDPGERAAAFLAEVCRRVAVLGAQWMAAGFVHGVLNTDNINVTGESFDYGPWRFLPTYDPAFTAAYFDHSGLYAYGRQPETLLWNLTRLAECLLPLAPQDALEAALEEFVPSYERALDAAVLRRLGLRSRGAEADAVLGRSLWQFLEASQAPFEQVFFDLYGNPAAPPGDIYRTEAFPALREALSGYAGASRDHAYFAEGRPCTMLIDEVEAIWEPIAADDDWSAFHAKLAGIARMRDAYGGLLDR